MASGDLYLKPICLVLGVDLSELISLEKPELSLVKLDPVAQARITSLLDKNNKGSIAKRERAELERLVDKVEKISLHNARERWLSTGDAGPIEPKAKGWAPNVDRENRVRRSSLPKCVGY